MLPLPRFLVQLAGWASSTQATCRYIPGDAGWPDAQQWHHLNATVGGRLIANVPLGQVCHDRGAFHAYNATACAKLGQAIMTEGAQTLQPRPGEVMNPYFQNLACSPFTPVSRPCELGDSAVYSVNVSGPADVQAGLKFAQQNNVRLVIKSTGIDYMGKSTGRGSLALWMYNLKTVEILDKYSSPFYSGSAVKLGSGVIAGEAYEAVSAAGYRIVAPECGLTGIVGGYTQGVGHSQLTTAYGLAADQVLEWELVTPSGEYLVATPEQHEDLYWALSGGGGGTYGVVLSATVRAHPDGPVAGGTLVVENTNETAFWEAVGIWFHQSPSFVEGSPNNVQFLVTNATLIVFAFVLPDQTTSAIDTLLSSFLPELRTRELPYHLTTSQSANYVESLVGAYGDLPYGNLCPNYPIISSRLIPRATVLNETSNAKLVDVFRTMTADGTWFIGCSVINAGPDPAVRPPHPANAVHPAWRDAVAYCNPNRPWDFSDPASSLAAKHRLVNDYFPAMEAATPGSGVNLNEMDPLYRGDWKEAMYGPNYGRLLSIKHKHDPHRLMYAHFAVGADEFTIDERGRVCDVGDASGSVPSSPWDGYREL
ncbi:putative FAD-dependent isoamyl alcohol oxidase [Ilyonectria sp. MPI-CAGE-AT-0026]|nr:putative FAD-dependent isoamyl alcohol oxidase [Ilyonectria sp. MPI-CAGE-AT-0026]